MTDTAESSVIAAEKAVPENYINRVTFGARLKQYARSPISLILMILVMLSALFAVGMLVFIPLCSVFYALFRRFVKDRLAEKGVAPEKWLSREE